MCIQLSTVGGQARRSEKAWGVVQREAEARQPVQKVAHRRYPRTRPYVEGAVLVGARGLATTARGWRVGAVELLLAICDGDV